MFACIFTTFWPKMAVFDGKIGERVVRYWPPNQLVLTLGLLPRCHFWRKSIKKPDHRHTDRHTQWQR